MQKLLCRAAPAHQLGVADLADDPLGTEAEREAQRLVAAVGSIVVEARRVGHIHPSEQPEERVARLPEAGPRLQGRRISCREWS